MSKVIIRELREVEYDTEIVRARLGSHWTDEKIVQTFSNDPSFFIPTEDHDWCSRRRQVHVEIDDRPVITRVSSLDTHPQRDDDETL